jgi:hypothetical protein
MTHRFNVTLTDEEYGALKGYSEYIDKPPARVAADLLREMYPTMKAVAQAMEAAKKKHSKGMDELRKLAIQEMANFTALASSIPDEPEDNQTDLFTQTQDNPK